MEDGMLRKGESTEGMFVGKGEGGDICDGSNVADV